MSYSTFLQTKKMIVEALEISKQAPIAQQQNVFETLMKAIQADGFERDYKQEIEEQSKIFMPIERFIEICRPSSNIERNLCFAYFCNRIKIDPVSINHIQACYELIGNSLNFNLQQSLRDTCSKRYGYLYTTDSNCYKIAPNANDFISSIEEELSK